MKKIFFLLLFSVFLCKSASSQVLIALLFGDKLNSDKLEFGLMAGPTMTDITGIDSKLDPGINFGLYFSFKLNDRFYFHPEAIPKLSFGAKGIEPYSTADAEMDSLFTNASVKRDIKAIGLPLLIRYRLVGRFFVEAGPQVNLTMKVKDVFETKINDNKLTYENRITDQFNRFDVGGVLGISYKILPSKQSITLGLRYYGGFSDIMKTASGRQSNSAWMLNVYIPIGVKNKTNTSKEN